MDNSNDDKAQANVGLSVETPDTWPWSAFPGGPIGYQNRKTGAIVSVTYYEQLLPSYKAIYAPAYVTPQPPAGRNYHIVFDSFPWPNGPRFIEVENDEGRSIGAGVWLPREDGLCELVLPIVAVPQNDPAPKIAAARQAERDLCNEIVREAWGDKISIDAIAETAALRAENERLREALEFYRDGFRMTPKRGPTGVNHSTWSAKPELLDDCGNIALAALEVDGKTEDQP
jgi:hypothetical protein